MPTNLAQSYVQPTAQGNVPFLANNGNPNIVYNQPGVGGGYIPPMFGNDGIWRVNPIPQSPWPFVGTPSWGSQGGFPIPTLPSGGFVAPQPTLPPPVVQQPAPPLGGPLPPDPLPQGPQGFGGGGAGPILEEPHPIGAFEFGFGGGLDPITGGSIFDYYNLDRQAGLQPMGGGGSSGSGFNYPHMNYNGPPTGLLGTANNLGFGDLRSWQQILDVISEPWLQGNLYNSQTGQWGTGNVQDWRQMLDLITQPFIPANLYDSYNQEWMWQQDYGREPNVAGYADPITGELRRWVLPAHESPFSQGISNPYAGISSGLFGNGNTGYGSSPFNLVNYANSSNYTQPTNDPWAGALPAVFGPGATPAGTEEQGCVVIDSYIGGGHEDRIADDIMVGSTMPVIDPVTYELSEGKVSYAETKLMPCVRITTKTGVVLDCSTTAPIADEDGNQVLAPDLLGVSIPIMDNGMIDYDVVMSVKDIGEKKVRHITVENNFFLAGKYKGRSVLHHNVKAQGGKNAGNPAAVSNEGPLAGMGSSLNWAGLKWGW